MKKLLSLITFTIIITNVIAQANTKKQDAAFDAFRERFVLALWQQYPNWASSEGFHKYDAVLSIPDQTTRNSNNSFCKRYLDSLKKFDTKNLSVNNQTDIALIQNKLTSSIWYNTTFKAYEWNPAQYNVCGQFAVMLADDYEPLDNRLRNFAKKMDGISAYYKAAKAAIKNPTVEHTQLAIAQNKGGQSAFKQDLQVALEKSGLTDNEKVAITAKAAETVTIIDDYINFLTNLKNATPRSFRIGLNLYSKKFEYDIQSAYTASQIFSFAVQEKQALHIKMYQRTKKLWSKYFAQTPMPTDTLIAIRKMIDTLSINHVSAAAFQTEIEKQIPQLVAFVNEKNLLYLDPSKPLVVRKEPDYMAGVAGASISAPGPYDKNANTYYNVGSIANWDAERAESYLREYNEYILQILNIHEAIPGHYTQLVYSNQSPSIIKAILGNGAMVEGWAVYTERMMLENGYGNFADEMWLMYYKWNLRTVCNTILDYSVHVNNLSKEAAIKLLINEAFQQKAEAEGKWKRVSVSQVQLCSYYTGYKEIYDLRTALQKKQGSQFNLKKFHETFLSFGSAPVKYISTIMNP